MIAADTDAEAERIAASAELHFVNRMKGQFLPLVPPAEAAAHPYSPIDRERLSQHRARLTVGGIDTVMRRLLPLIEATRADELMITSLIFDHAARRHSYELLAKAFALAPHA